MDSSILLLRAGFHREFALKTLLRKDIEVMMIDKPFTPELAYADYPYIIDDIWDPKKMFDRALEIYKKKKFDGIFTTADSSIIALGMLSDYFDKDYLDENTARIVSSKLEVRKFLNNIGADETKFLEINSIDDLYKCSEKLGYPYVLKPTERSSGKGVTVVKNGDKLPEIYGYVRGYSGHKPLIAEEFIAGDEYCAEFIIINGEVYLLAISKKLVTDNEHCIELVDITPAPLDDRLKTRIEDYFKETISEFHIKNLVLHIEFKLNGEQIKIIEINPRPAGGNIIEAIFDLKGLNVYDIAYDMALGREIDIDWLRNYIRQPFDKYAIFNSFIKPAESGVIKYIGGIERAAKELVNEHERMTLFYKKGDFLPVPETNGEARGFIYLIDSDYNTVVERSGLIESLLEYELE